MTSTIPGTTSHTATAPGKLMLLGEHAVVYGHPCLVTTVGLYVSATVSLADDALVQIKTPTLRQRGSIRRTASRQLGQALEPETAFVEAALARVCAAAGHAPGLLVSTDGPALSYGLGSSSAVTVAAVAACASALGLVLSQRELFELAYHAVLDAQGKGSGFDVAAAVYGGTLWYEGAGQVIEPLDTSALPVIIGYSGAKVSTRRFVDGVGQLRARNQRIIDRLFDLITELVVAARPAMLQQNWAALGDLLDINQGLLDALGVNTPALARLIVAAREAGALGAKLSGAGGGDCMFALAPDLTLEPVRQALNTVGQHVNLQLGVPGVSVFIKPI